MNHECFAIIVDLAHTRNGKSLGAKLMGGYNTVKFLKRMIHNKKSRPTSPTWNQF
jgi:hypothetical protein